MQEKRGEPKVVPFAENGTGESDVLSILTSVGLTKSEEALIKFADVGQDIKELVESERPYRTAFLGGKSPTPEEYKATKQLSCDLSAHGIDVVTGAGPGFMAAANEGAIEGRQAGKVGSVGLSIHAINGQPTNSFIGQEHGHRSIFTRLQHFDLLCSSFVLMHHGGVGFFAELFVAWQQSQFYPARKTLILVVGNRWPKLLKSLEEDWGFRKEEIALISPVSSTEEALRRVLAHHEDSKQVKAAG